MSWKLSGALGAIVWPEVRAGQCWPASLTMVSFKLFRMSSKRWWSFLVTRKSLFASVWLWIEEIDAPTLLLNFYAAGAFENVQSERERKESVQNNVEPWLDTRPGNVWPPHCRRGSESWPFSIEPRVQTWETWCTQTVCALRRASTYAGYVLDRY